MWKQYKSKQDLIKNDPERCIQTNLEITNYKKNLIFLCRAYKFFIISNLQVEIWKLDNDAGGSELVKYCFDLKDNCIT